MSLGSAIDPEPDNLDPDGSLCSLIGICGSPLVVDADFNGTIPTSGEKDWVRFDLDGDGVREATTWTALDQPDPFLWLDLNGDGQVDGGVELFGDATHHPLDDDVAANGFDALAWYDTRRLGGNGDGLIAPEDEVWGQLSLWTDLNHDGSIDLGEVQALQDTDIVALGLDYRFELDIDSSGNGHFYKGAMLRRSLNKGEWIFESAEIHDLYFLVQRE